METVESNKLISEFMGIEPKMGYRNNRKVAIYDIFPGKYTDKELKYHSEWAWIMRVVRKIYNESNLNVKKNSGLEIFSIGIGEPIEVVYQAVSEFIQWHNTQTNPNN